MGGGAPQRGRTPAGVDPARPGARLPRDQRIGRFSLQDHDLLRARGRAKHPLERSGARRRMAVGGRDA
eukprot:19480-Eustigmatos_ZCMA.PRE.1